MSNESDGTQRQLPNRGKNSCAYLYQILSSNESDLSEQYDDSIQITNKTTSHKQIDQLQYNKENNFFDNSHNNKDSDTQKYDYDLGSSDIPRKDACVQTDLQCIIYLGSIPKEKEFKITYNRSKPMRKTQVHEYQNDNLLFDTKSVKDKIIGKIHIVNINNLMNANCTNSVGTIVRRSKGTMFTLYENYSIIISNNRQLAGIAFYTEVKNKKYRKINLAIPIYDNTINCVIIIYNYNYIR